MAYVLRFWFHTLLSIHQWEKCQENALGERSLHVAFERPLSSHCTYNGETARLRVYDCQTYSFVWICSVNPLQAMTDFLLKHRQVNQNRVVSHRQSSACLRTVGSHNIHPAFTSQSKSNRMSERWKISVREKKNCKTIERKNRIKMSNGQLSHSC